jgi:RimJ/RimL family protein N-acetyltransferase
LGLRLLREEDVSEAYLGWMSDPRVTQYLEARFHLHTMEDLRRYVACTPIMGLFNNGTHVGNIKLDTNEHHGRGDIGLLIGPEHWGKGYATWAIKAMTDYAFYIGLHKVTAGAYAGNVGSIRAFEKAGFEQEGVLRDHWLVDGEYQDGILLGKVNV